MPNYLLNQRAWFVAREVSNTHPIEYLDNDRDVFYVEGVRGYATKKEAHDRVKQYKGDSKGLFIIGPKYGRYRIDDTRDSQRQHKNTQLARLELLDRSVTDNTVDELRIMIRDFVLFHGIWCFSNLNKTKQFLHLCRKYNVLTNDQIARLVYEF